MLWFNDTTNKPSGAAADGVLGQPDFISRDPTDTASGMGGPCGATISANGSLYVSCLNQHRVLRFDNAAGPRPNGDANAVFGQPSFTANTSGLSAIKMEGPIGAWITAEDSLWVTDFYNNRLLRFDNASTATTNPIASGVIGQANFTIPAAFRTRRGLAQSPRKPFVDGNGSLWITDSGNNRVLRFSPPADAVLKVTSINKSGTTVTIGFQGMSGLSYRLNKSTTLDFTTPNIRSTTLTGSSLGSLQDTTSTEPAAFYRVETQ